MVVVLGEVYIDAEGADDDDDAAGNVNDVDDTSFCIFFTISSMKLILDVDEHVYLAGITC